jgi:hypothetical protein
LDDIDESQADKYLSNDSISAATALLTTTPSNGIIHSSKPSVSSVRQRVRFKSCAGEHQHSHHEHT